MNQDLNTDLLKEPTKAFEYHLDIPSNHRIIFSGRFGIGKSTFVNHFFDQAEKYNYIHLYPVNYSIASNEDIFRYMKFDIILEMIAKSYPIENLDFTKWQSLPGFLKKNFRKLTATLLYAIPAVGKDIADIANKMTEFADDFEKHHQDNNDKGNEKNALEKYLSEFENFDGGLYESGLETKIIESVLKQKKEKDSGKENVLIIDDLDRIDPEHIFRILNVFAAHFDYQDASKNKFGFDKVILVCDIDNVRSIFHHKYGGEVDFNGYIDKFYSHEIFQFLNRKSLVQFVRESLQSIEWKSSNLNDGQVHGHKNNILHNNSFLPLFMAELCHLGILNLRSVVKWNDKPFHISEHEWFEDRQLNINVFPAIVVMRFLVTFFGSATSLVSTIDKISPNKFAFNKAVMESFCFDLITLFSRMDGNNYDVKISFIHRGIEYSTIYEKSGRREYNLKINRLESFQNQSKTAHALSVDAEILKMCMLKYLEHSA